MSGSGGQASPSGEFKESELKPGRDGHSLKWVTGPVRYTRDMNLKKEEELALAQGVLCVTLFSLVVINALVVVTQDALRTVGVKHRLLGNMGDSN